MVGEHAGDIHQSVAAVPASIGHRRASPMSGGGQLQRAGLLGSIVERASEALATRAQRAHALDVVLDREIEHSASPLDALHDRIGVTDRELLRRTLQTPVERVLADDPLVDHGRRSGREAWFGRVGDMHFIGLREP